ncbi:hypothetical protein HHI36_019567 [Cryptolaemus montrouzieri]|uniref:RRM domain-containing protein n=1 Tax=Cryptolaemus montrouzieri TaxID=559131 RepID=A0ABD2N7R0_9CUCU
MAPTIKCFKYPMKVEEITGQRILISTKEAEDEVFNSEIFAKGIPCDATEEELVPFFERIGPVHTFRLMMNERKTANRGYVYVTYLKKSNALDAINELNGKEIRRYKPITIELSLNNCRIFIGGVPVDKTKDQVWHELIKQGLQNIVDVIMYRSYNNRAANRGFVFVEFPSHKLAARMRCRHKDLTLWGNKVIVDWSVPQPEIPEEIMSEVKILYLRNLNVMQSREELKKILESFIDAKDLEKLYKFKNYAFVHCGSRSLAEKLLKSLQGYYKGTHVEVSFAKPPNHYTQPEYRKYQMSRSSPHSRIRKMSLESSSSATSVANKENIDYSNSSTYSKDSTNTSPSYIVTPNHCTPYVLKYLEENSVNPHQCSSYLNKPYTKEFYPCYYKGASAANSIDFRPNYVDNNFLRNQHFMNQTGGNIVPVSVNHFLTPLYQFEVEPTSYARSTFDGALEERKLFGRTRYNSAMSDLTDCCPSTVLKEYQEMLEDAFNK